MGVWHAHGQFSIWAKVVEENYRISPPKLSTLLCLLQRRKISVLADDKKTQGRSVNTAIGGARTEIGAEKIGGAQNFNSHVCRRASK